MFIAQATDASTAQPFQPIVPELGVPIPGLEFTPATQQGTNVVVPYFSQYINAGYHYMVGVILIVAIIMVVWGGFRYLLGSADISNISRAKEIIRDAIVGMLLVIGAFVILNTVNPATTDLRSLELSSVQRDEIELSLLANTEDNADPETPWSSEGSVSAGLPAASSARRTFTTCPVSLTQPENRARYENNPRSQEFMQLMTGVMPGGTRDDRMIGFLEAATQCQVYLGSCLHSAEIAGGFAEGRPGTSQSRGRRTHSISSELFSTLRANRCTRDAAGCSLSAQRAEVFQRIATATPGWPDAWLSDLQPGDSIVIFNANPIDVNGCHTQVFVGWSGNGRARVLQGSPGRPVRWGNVCLSSACGSPYPLIRTFSANR